MTRWFKKHPEYLRRETDALSRDSNYKQTDIFRNKLLVSQGNIIVRLEKIHRFPFLIVYPNSMPYALPLFFPLKALLSSELVEGLSKMEEQALLERVAVLVQYHYRLRHQNASGMLCTVDWHSLEQGPAFTGIKTLIKRVTDWCRGLVTGHFPPDSQEVEFSAHFTDTIYDMDFSYPAHFLDEKLSQGEAFAILTARIWPSKLYGRGHTGYLGQLIFGQQPAGLTGPGTEQIFPEILVERGIRTELELVTNTELVEKALEGDGLIRMCWFDLDSEPGPFHTVDELVGVIGNGNHLAGAERLAGTCLPYLKAKPSEFYIAIRFKGRSGKLEFQLFKLFKGSSVSPHLFGVSDRECLESILIDYKRVAAIPSHLFDEQSYHLRNQGRADRGLLKELGVNILGVGAVGSEVADSLAKAGVGNLLLVDNQRMKVENSIRHLVGTDKVGYAKVVATRAMLLEHNPFVKVAAIPLNITQMPLLEIMDGTISVSCIGEDNTEAYLNENAVIYGHTVYYIRALRGGKAGRIFRVIPGVDACIRCLELFRAQKKEFIPVAEDEALPVLFTECNNPVRAASAADLKIISSVASRLILDELQAGPGGDNQWIWSTEELPQLGAYKLHPQFIPPHDRCTYCHHEKKISVKVHLDCLQQMQVLVAASVGIETGGVLGGYLDGEGNVVITNASGPGSMAICSATGFQKDVVHCQRFLDELYKGTAGARVYLGEWHSHPNENNQPSARDLQSLSEISSEPNYLTEKPVMIIFSSSGKPSITIHPVGKRFYHASLEILNEPYNA